MPQGNNMECKFWPSFKLIAKFKLTSTWPKLWLEFTNIQVAFFRALKRHFHKHRDVCSPLSQLIPNDWCGLVGLPALHSSQDCQQGRPSLTRLPSLPAVLPHSALSSLYPEEQAFLTSPQDKQVFFFFFFFFKLKLKGTSSGKNICISCACRF